MSTINVYLNFNGRCEAAFNFYKSVFGGEFTSINRFSEMPTQPGMPAMEEEMQKQIMHVSLPIGKDSVLMGSDVGNEFATNFAMGNNFSLSVTPESKAHADELFAKLSDGAEITMPLGNTFWGSYFGMLTDKFGVNWMLNLEEAQA